MQVYEEAKYTTYCGTPDEWEQLREKLKDVEKVSILDLRSGVETAGNEIEDIPEEWLFVNMPVTGLTVSEQDIDVFRREQRRHGTLVALATNETRGSLLALADKARLARTQLPKDELKKLNDTKKEKDLVDWLNSYLERHQTTDVIGEI